MKSNPHIFLRKALKFQGMNLKSVSVKDGLNSAVQAGQKALSELAE